MKKFNLRNIKNRKGLIILLMVLSIGIVGGTYALFKLSHSVDNNLSISNPSVVLEEKFPITVFSSDARTLDKEVYVRNYGTADMLVRVSYSEFFYNPNFSTRQYTDAYTSVVAYDGLGEVVQKNWTQEFLDDWIYHEGWYYYTKVFEGNEEYVDTTTGSVTSTPEEQTNKYTATATAEYAYNNALQEIPATNPVYNDGVTVNSLKILESVTVKGDYTPHPYYGLEYRLDFNMESAQATPEAIKDLWGFDVTISESGEVTWSF